MEHPAIFVGRDDLGPPQIGSFCGRRARVVAPCNAKIDFPAEKPPLLVGEVAAKQPEESPSVSLRLTAPL